MVNITLFMVIIMYPVVVGFLDVNHVVPVSCHKIITRIVGQWPFVCRCPYIVVAGSPVQDSNHIHHRRFRPHQSVVNAEHVLLRRLGS